MGIFDPQITADDLKHGEVVGPDRERVLITRDHEEWIVLAHMRGWCHDLSNCVLCAQMDRACKAERDLERVIAG